MTFQALVVETNYLVASAVEGPLLANGFRVIVAVDDAGAQKAVAANRFDVAIIDFRLQHSGPEGLVARLEAAGVPYIFCTAASTSEVVESFPGAQVIEKPFGDDMLLLVVNEALRNAEWTA